LFEGCGARAYTSFCFKKDFLSKYDSLNYRIKIAVIVMSVVTFNRIMFYTKVMSRLLILFALLAGCVFAQNTSIGLFELYAPVSDYCPSEGDSHCTTSNKNFFYLDDDFSGFNNQFSIQVGEKNGIVDKIQLISKSNFTDEQLDTDVVAIVQQLYDFFVDELSAPNFAVKRISEATWMTKFLRYRF